MKKLLALFILFPVSGWSQFVMCSFTVNYDSISPLIDIDTVSANIWQIGPPQKVPFMWSYSPPNVIVTDTVNPYPTNNQSSFTLTIPTDDGQCTGFNVTELSFWHKYETDSLLDLGIMEQSWNHGLTWYGMTNRSGGLDTFNCELQYWDYDRDSLGNWLSAPDSVISGYSNGWIHSKFVWIWQFGVIHNLGMPNYPDTVLVRFTCKSDSIHNPKAGWMIDNMLVQHLLVSGVEKLSEHNINIFPNPSTNEIIIENAELRIEKVELYNTVGEKVFSKQQTTHDKQQTVDVSQLLPGVYFVAVTDDKGNKITRKFIKM